MQEPYIHVSKPRDTKKPKLHSVLAKELEGNEKNNKLDCNLMSSAWVGNNAQHRQEISEI